MARTRVFSVLAVLLVVFWVLKMSSHSPATEVSGAALRWSPQGRRGHERRMREWSVCVTLASPTEPMKSITFSVTIMYCTVRVLSQKLVEICRYSVMVVRVKNVHHHNSHVQLGGG